MGKKARSLPAQRRIQLTRMIETRGSVSIPELAGLFEVSTDTIRRDLDALADSGIVVRDHGGAMRPVEADRLTPFEERMQSQLEGKQAIARAVATLVRDGETLIVNGGSTTLMVMNELNAHHNTVLITSSIAMLDQVDLSRFASIHVLSGEYIPTTRVVVGPILIPQLERINVDTAIIGIRALNLEKGPCTSDLAEAAMLSSMMELARRTIVVADATKFGKSAFATIAPLAKIDILVTDTAPTPTFQTALRDAGVRLIVA